MISAGPNTLSKRSEAPVFLPTFEETFICKTSSMTTDFEFQSQRKPNLQRQNRPHRSAKRQLEQVEEDKVLVQPAHVDIHHAKKIRSDWDSIFFSSNDNFVDGPGLFTSSHKTERTSNDNFADGPGLFSSSHKTERPRKSQKFVVKRKEMKTFFHLLEDQVIGEFISRDKCMKITDKYLLAMVFVYFKRAGYTLRDYNRRNFFIALYLANDMEEDEEELKYEIFPWALGRKWQDKFPSFLRKRDKLFARIDHQAVVSWRCCEEIIAIDPTNAMWQRNRPSYHGGAVRSYMKDPSDDGHPTGPHGSPRRCPECESTDSQYDSASDLSDDVSWYVSSGGSSPLNTAEEFFEKPLQSTFDMKGLKRTLQDTEDSAWPGVEE